MNQATAIDSLGHAAPAAPVSEAHRRAEDAYLRMVTRARNVGHQAGRQLLLRVQKQYPKAHLSILGHSLGCEVAAACLLPGPALSLRPATPPFRRLLI